MGIVTGTTRGSKRIGASCGCARRVMGLPRGVRAGSTTEMRRRCEGGIEGLNAACVESSCASVVADAVMPIRPSANPVTRHARTLCAVIAPPSSALLCLALLTIVSRGLNRATRALNALAVRFGNPAALRGVTFNAQRVTLRLTRSTFHAVGPVALPVRAHNRYRRNLRKQTRVFRLMRIGECPTLTSRATLLGTSAMWCGGSLPFSESRPGCQ